MGKRIWNILGYDGTRKIFEHSLPVSSLSEAEMKVLLLRLASRHLTDNEIVSASLRRNSKQYAPLLEIHSIGQHKVGFMTSGTSPYYVATLEMEDRPTT